jgi:hypothetical protein
MVNHRKLLLVRVLVMKFFFMPSLESSVDAFQSEIYFNSKSELVVLGFTSWYMKLLP